MASNVSRNQDVFGPVELGYVAHAMAFKSGGSQSSNRGILACSSFIPQAANFVEIFNIDFNTAEPVKPAGVRLPHYYPSTKACWFENTPHTSNDILVTSGDNLRIWSATGELKRLLGGDQNPRGVCTPITGVDVWSADSNIMASVDVYGIFSLWDVERGEKTQAMDLDQPLLDVAFSKDGRVAAIGERGDCFLIDRRSNKDVEVFVPRAKVSGPGRLAWGRHRPDLFAAAWQSGRESIVVYGDSAPGREQATPHMLQTTRGVCADLQWSSAFPEFLCCAQEAGYVEVWQFPERGLEAASAETGPCFRWEPAPGNSCTALVTTPEVQQGQHAVIVAVTPSSGTEAKGALWLAKLPEPTRSRGVVDAAVGHVGVAFPASDSAIGTGLEEVPAPANQARRVVDTGAAATSAATGTAVTTRGGVCDDFAGMANFGGVSSAPLSATGRTIGGRPRPTQLTSPPAPKPTATIFEGRPQPMPLTSPPAPKPTTEICEGDFGLSAPGSSVIGTLSVGSIIGAEMDGRGLGSKTGTICY